MPEKFLMQEDVLPSHKRLLYPPGGILVWFIILLELITFLAALGLFLFERQNSPELFRSSQLLLNRDIGTLNTVILLTGGYLMVLALKFLLKCEQKKFYLTMLFVFISGVLFLGVKGYEYAEKLRLGITLRHDTFFTYYWLITGFHYLHVLAAVILIFFLLKNVCTQNSSQINEDAMAIGAFWHMCDLIWILIFPVLYLLP